MKLANWGNFPRIETTFKEPRDVDALADAAGVAPSLTARGLGRCYGDSALNKNMVISTLGLDKFIAFDAESGVLAAEAGVSLAEILDVFVSRGWFLPVTPGTKFVTLGGAIASDVHGKNHHIAGTFGRHVLWLDILTSKNGIVRCSEDENRELFYATIGGHGLTGIILRAAFRLVRIPSAWIAQTTIKATNLQEIMQAFEEEASAPYSVAWIDCLQRGRHMGRSILMLGDFAEAARLPESVRKSPYVLKKKNMPGVPFNFPSFTLNPLSVRAFNALYYSKAPHGRAENIVSCNTFFYPLDAVAHWNRIYGKKGMAQYQFVIPKEAAAEGLPKVLETIAASGAGSFLAVLKLFGEQTWLPGNISFPEKGYTLALDFPMTGRLLRLLDRLDEMVLDYGGHHYLTKDSRMQGSTFRKGYGKKLDDFLEVKARWDSDGKYISAQAERLGIA